MQHYPQFESAADLRTSLISSTSLARMKDVEARVQDAIVTQVIDAARTRPRASTCAWCVWRVCVVCMLCALLFRFLLLPQLPSVCRRRSQPTCCPALCLHCRTPPTLRLLARAGVGMRDEPHPRAAVAGADAAAALQPLCVSVRLCWHTRPSLAVCACSPADCFFVCPPACPPACCRMHGLPRQAQGEKEFQAKLLDLVQRGVARPEDVEAQLTPEGLAAFIEAE